MVSAGAGASGASDASGASPARRVLVLYGSETGNAQDVAERVVREAKLKHYAPVLMTMEGYDVRTLPRERCVVFVTSTTGQGDEPRNMKSFWRFLLRRSLSATSLTNMSYAVFGLGDSGYQKYNVTAKKLFRRLQGLGANAIEALGLGDDQHPLGYEAALNPWLRELWKSMREIFPLPPHLKDLTEAELSSAPLPACRFVVEEVACAEGIVEASGERLMEAHTALRLALAAADASDASTSFSKAEYEARESRDTTYYDGFVSENRCLTSDDAVKEVRHLEFQTLDASIAHYEAGDVLGVIPFATRAADAKVSALIERLGVSPDAWVRVYPSSAPETKAALFPLIQVKYLLAGAIDVDSASPRRYFFEVMSHFAESEHEKERLQYFASAEGAVDLYKYNQRERRTVCEIFDDFPSLKPSLAWLLQVAPHLHPRYYSISSSPADTERTAATHITVAAAEWVTPMKRARKGLCSSWLNSLDVGTRVKYSITKGSISLPPPETPLILIGPGTGIAPFRSFVRARVLQSSTASALVVFGCRHARHDYLYKEEWKQIEKDGSLIGSGGDSLGGVVVAFSRMVPEAKKRYVQDCVKDEAKRIWSLLEAGAKVFVAGSAEKMPAAVHKAIQEVVREQGLLDEDASARYMTKLETTGRYFVDAW